MPNDAASSAPLRSRSLDVESRLSQTPLDQKAATNELYAVPAANEGVQGGAPAVIGAGGGALADGVAAGPDAGGAAAPGAAGPPAPRDGIPPAALMIPGSASCAYSGGAPRSGPNVTTGSAPSQGPDMSFQEISSTGPS